MMAIVRGKVLKAEYDGNGIPVHVNCRCVVVPVASTEPLPGEDVLTQAERVVVEYEAARASGSCNYRRGG